MIVLVSGATTTLLRYRDDPRFGVLCDPSRFAGFQLPTGPWAADNGAFSGFDATAFTTMLSALKSCPGCLFVTAPDVVGDCAATDALWQTWHPRIQAQGFPVAYVLQDGCTAVPWDACAAVFLGGSTDWKLSRPCAALVDDAKQRGKWVHMGRVSSRRRLRYATDLQIDSIDGSGFSRWPDQRFAEYCQWDDQLRAQPRLPL